MEHILPIPTLACFVSQEHDWLPFMSAVAECNAWAILPARALSPLLEPCRHQARSDGLEANRCRMGRHRDTSPHDVMQPNRLIQKVIRPNMKPNPSFKLPTNSSQSGPSCKLMHKKKNMGDQLLPLKLHPRIVSVASSSIDSCAVVLGM